MKYLIFCILILLSTAQKCNKKREIGLSEIVFSSRWVHSYEDDKDGLSAYRPSSYKFPPARGRRGFEMKKDGTFIYHQISPVDKGNDKKQGQWNQLEDNKIIVTANGEQQTLEFVSVNPEIIYVREY
jgi:hypothetical protein